MIQLLVGKYIPSKITFHMCIFICVFKGRTKCIRTLELSDIKAPVYELLKYFGASNQILCSVWFFQTSSMLTRYGKNGSMNIGGSVIQRADHFSRSTSNSLYHFPHASPIGLSNLKYIPSFPSHLTISIFAFDYCYSITFKNKQNYGVNVFSVL